METLLWLWGWIKVIFFWAWLAAGTLSMIAMYCRIRMLNELITWKEASLFMLAIWCPFLNLLVFTMGIIPLAASMIFMPSKFKFDHLDDTKKARQQRRQQYALDFIEKQGLAENLDDYIDAKMLMGKMVNPEEKTS